jgi:hypothetical protein
MADAIDRASDFMRRDGRLFCEGCLSKALARALVLIVFSIFRAEVPPTAERTEAYRPDGMSVEVRQGASWPP